MPETLELSEIPEPVEARQLHAVGMLMGEILSKKGFAPGVLEQFNNHVLDGLKVSFIPEKDKSHFYDVGMIEKGVTDGRYEVEMGGKSIENRVNLLKGHVPEGSEK